ncbi:UDP-glucose 4-epimerase [Candidatus Magnetobacterium bavaricum]|uniref:UDP-glucose 4-epimerase n=1 Tax=Candidatus Magnetobacterium bavaricum TaxID=29290 RepID=A0A0F3GN12_9BACT|nr:UDP-glucose 4-epimerase [Candidatus Magnetobacterium bavaricum]
MKDKRHIVVTGGAGFIGSTIAIRLIAEGHKVTILDNLSTGKEENIPLQADFLKVDIGNEQDGQRYYNIDCDVVFHIAGQSSGEASFDNPLYDLKSHVMSTFYILQWCKKKNIKRFMYSSSMSVYGDPEYLPVDEIHPLRPKSFYGAAKISAEAYINLFHTLGINTTVFRLFSVYGPQQNLENKKQGIVSIYLSYMLEKIPILVKGSKNRVRDLIYIDDVLNLWMTALDNPISYGQTYNVATGKGTMVEELLETMKMIFEITDYPINYTSGTPGDVFGIVGNNTKAKKHFNWQPTIDIGEGLKKMTSIEKIKTRDNKRS